MSRRKKPHETARRVEAPEETGVPVRPEGGGHSIWENPANRRRAPVKRHREIPDIAVQGLCKELGIPVP
jgi:hypothetical protein